MATFLLASLYFFIRSRQGREPWQKDYLLCGIMVGFAMLLKQVAVVNFFVLGYFIAIKKRETIDSGQARMTRKRTFSLFALGATLPWIPIGIYLFANSALKEALNQIVVVNFTSYPREPISNVVKYLAGTFKQTLPVWVLFGIFIYKKTKLFVVIPHLMRNPEKSSLDSRFRGNDKKERVVLDSTRTINNLLLSSIILPIPLLLIRHYPHYWLQIVPFISIFAGIALYDLIQGKKGFWTSQNDTIRIFFLVLIISSFYMNLRWFSWMSMNINNIKLKEQIEATKYIKNLPQKNLLAENQFTAFYFLTNKEPLTKYLYMTEINESENAEQITIEALKQNPGTIILWPKDPKFAFAKDLQNYILENYSPVKEYPSLELMIYENSNEKIQISNEIQII